MTSQKPSRVGLLHYSAAPVIGGVESVLLTHARLFTGAGYPTTILAGRGAQEAMPPGTKFVELPELDSQHPKILRISQELEQGTVPRLFEKMVANLAERLVPLLEPLDALIVHNVFTKHFNIPLTAALFRLLEAGAVGRCIAWCHDMTWSSPSSRSKMHPGYPWDLLRTHRPDVTYVTISRERQKELAALLDATPDSIRVIYNGVEPRELLGLSDTGMALTERLGLWESDLNLLLPVRVTQAKNIELAIRVIAALRAANIHAVLVITGPPDPHEAQSMEYFRSLLHLREQLGVSQQVRFVYESGLRAAEPLIVEMALVAELFRVCDALLMPSHREGFGMPVVEAGLAGLPVFCSSRVPAAQEIGAQDVMRFSPDEGGEQVASLIVRWMENSPVFQLRKRVRQGFTWQSIFRHAIVPLVDQGGS